MSYLQKFERRKQRKRNVENKKLKCAKSGDIKTESNIIVANLFTLFMINITLVSVFGYIFYNEWFSFKTNTIDNFSVPCSSLSLSADEDYVTFELNKSDLKTYFDNKGKLICSKNNITEILLTITERALRIQQALGKEKRYLSCGNENLREASGYQTAIFREILKQQNKSDTKLYWSRHPSKFYYENSIKYENGEVTIQEGQDYYLYASVHFNVSEKTRIDQKGSQIPQRMTLRICKAVNGYEQTLTAKSKLFDMTTTGNVVGSLRVETHVHLRKNDKIYVRVNDASSIIYSSKGNTFGLFPL